MAKMERGENCSGITTPRSILMVTAVLLLGVILALAFNHLSSSRARNPENIPVSGTIEADEIRLGFKTPGRIARLTVREGTAIKHGQEMARLDDRQLRAQWEQARAAAAASEANLRLLEAGARPQEIRRAELAERQALENYRLVQEGARKQEIAQARAAVAQAEANWRNAHNNLARMRDLLRQQVITQQQFDGFQTQETVAAKQLQVAKAALDLVLSGARPQQVAMAEQQWHSAREQTSLVRAGSRVEQIAVARAQLRQARAAVQVLESQLADAVIRSPLDGVVMTRAADAGEIIGAGSAVYTVADLRTLWLRVYVPESQIGLVRLGHAVRFTVDSFPGRYFGGRVAEISSQAEFTPKNAQTQEERVTQVFAVRVRIANPRLELKPGLPADGFILVKENPVLSRDRL